MTSCELCGKQATTKARIEGVAFTVCAGCANLGSELREAPRQQPRPAHSRPAQAETYLVSDCGQRLRKARQRMGLSEKDAALKLNIREIELKHYESGKLLPSESVARKLEKFYGISLYEAL